MILDNNHLKVINLTCYYSKSKCTSLSLLSVYLLIVVPLNLDLEIEKIIYLVYTTELKTFCMT